MTALESTLGGAVEASLSASRRVLQQLGAHHGRQRQGHHRGDQDGHRQRDGKFAEQAAHDVAHEQQRDQDGNQRDGQRDDGEPDLLRALQCRLQRTLACLDIAGDVFDHHDGVIDHEAGRDRQRHQRQVVQAVPEQVHHAERADQRQRHRNAGDDRGGKGCAGTGRSPCTTRPMVSISSNCTSSTEARMVVVRSVRMLTCTDLGSVVVSCGSSALMRSTTAMMLAPAAAGCS